MTPASERRGPGRRRRKRRPSNRVKLRDDIDDQGPTFDDVTLANANYAYDREGRLVSDVQESIDKIVWRVDGKIKEIEKSGPNAKRLKFDYDAMGHRIAKHVYNYSTGVLEKNTYYILDAQGNVMNVYELLAQSSIKYNLIERQLYGSSRLGMLTGRVSMLSSSFSTNPLRHAQGNKLFELTNHLGNVLAVVQDKLKPTDLDHDGVVDGHRVWIAQSTDYSPFGVSLRGRSLPVGGTSDYRYGFQGQEEDDEIKGDGNSLNYKYRMHDPRLGRFFAIDPLAADYAHSSPYAFGENCVINAVELEGLERRYTFNSAKTTAKFAAKLKAYDAGKISYDQLVYFLNAHDDAYITDENTKSFIRRKLAQGNDKDHLRIENRDNGVRYITHTGGSTEGWIVVDLVVENADGSNSLISLTQRSGDRTFLLFRKKTCNFHPFRRVLLQNTRMKLIFIFGFWALLFEGTSYGQVSGKTFAVESPASDPAFEKYCEQHALSIMTLPSGKTAPRFAGEITLRDGATYRDYGILLKESETQYYKVAGSDKVMQVQSLYRLRVGHEASKR